MLYLLHLETLLSMPYKILKYPVVKVKNYYSFLRKE